MCSAYVLERVLHELSPDTVTTIVCPEGVNAPTRQLLENLGIAAPVEETPQDIDTAVLVDTNNLDQLGRASAILRETNAAIIVVDHHHPHPDTVKLARLLIVEESAAAAAEVVYRLHQAAKLRLGRLESSALLAAIFVETKHFLLANSSTFKVGAELVEAGAEPRRLAEMLSTPMTRAERIARLKAAARSQVVIVGQWIIATSELGAYQSSAARALLGLGADVALVAGQVKENIRVNARATESFYNRTGIHLARDAMIPVGQKLGGTGGGHPTAAGLSARGTVELVLEECLRVLREQLRRFQS